MDIIALIIAGTIIVWTYDMYVHTVVLDPSPKRWGYIVLMSVLWGVLFTVTVIALRF